MRYRGFPRRYVPARLFGSRFPLSPVGVKGVAASLREFTTFALNQHHGIQPVERFGWERSGRRDFDEDGKEVAVTIGQVTAMVLFQAALADVVVERSLRSEHLEGRAPPDLGASREPDRHREGDDRDDEPEEMGAGEGCALRDAVLEGSRVRFRPILMTDVVTIVGVLTLVPRGGSGSELHHPLAIVYIGGFVGALLLRVVIVPVLYEAMATVFDRPGSDAGTPDAGEARARLT